MAEAETDIAREIERDLAYYNSLKTRARNSLASGDVEKSLFYVYMASTFGWHNHLGIWVDEELEGILKRAGNIISERRKPQEKKNKKAGNRVLHIASTLSDIGGHSRTLVRFFEAIKVLSYEQIIFITNMSNQSEVKFSFLEGRERAPEVSQLSPEVPFADRIMLLMDLIEENPGTIILYIDPNDIIAVTALFALKKRQRVLFFNHADHVFWLGKGVIDTLLEWRIEGSKYSKQYRGMENLCLVPLSTDIKPQRASKESLGVPPDATLSLSVTTYYKIQESPGWNYFDTIKRLLRENPGHYHILVACGLPPDAESLLGDDPDIRRRFIMRGGTSDLAAFYGTADLLIESFPAGGGTVRIEAMASGLPLVAVRINNFTLLSETTLPQDYPLVASSEDEVVRDGSVLIRESVLRENIGRKLHEFFHENHRPERTGSLLRDIVLNPMASNIKSSELNKVSYNLGFAYMWAKNHAFCSARLLSFQPIASLTFELKERIGLYKDYLQCSEAKTAQFAELLAQKDRLIEALQNQIKGLENLKNSLSWRVTAPLRWLKEKISG